MPFNYRAAIQVMLIATGLSLAIRSAKAQPEASVPGTIHYTLRCTSSEEPAERNLYRLLYEMAVPKAKNPMKEGIAYQIAINHDLTENNNSEITYSGSLKIEKISLLKHYEGFDLGYFLIPSAIEISLETLNGNVKGIVECNDSVAPYTFSLNRDNPARYTDLKINAMRFDVPALERFLDAMISVRDYKAAAGLEPILSAEVTNRFDDPWQELMAIVWYSHAGEVLRTLPVWITKGLTGQDPQFLEARAKGVDVEAYRRQLAFQRPDGGLHRLGILPSAKAVAWLGDQIARMQQSTESRNPYSTPLINQLTSLPATWQAQAEELLTTMLLSDSSRLADSPQLHLFFGQVAADLLTRGEQIAKEEKFNEALPYAISASFFARISHNAAIERQAHQLISHIHHGILDAWLTISTRALQAGSFSMSRQYIEKASQYQKANHEFIVSALALNKAIETYIDSSLNQAVRLSRDSNQTKAMARLDEAIPLLNELPYYSRKAQFSITHSITCTKHYEMLLNQAVEWLDSGKRHQGRTGIRRAVRFRQSRPTLVNQREEEKIGLKMLALLDADSLINLARNSDTTDWFATAPFLDKASLLLDSVAPLKSDSVRWKLSRAALEQSRQHFKSVNLRIGHGDFEESLRLQTTQALRLDHFIRLADSLHLEQLIEARERNQRAGCQIISQWNEALVTAAYDAALVKDFGQSLQLITKARSLVSQKPDCLSDTSAIAALANRYNEVWRFTKQLARVDTLLKAGKTDNAVAWFDLCYSNYQLNFMKLADMPVPSLEKYLIRYPQQRLIDTVMHRKFATAQANELVTLFEFLRSQQTDARPLQHWLTELGNRLAADCLANQNDKKLYINQFRNDKEWYKPASERFIGNVGKNWIHRQWLQLLLLI